MPEVSTQQNMLCVIKAKALDAKTNHMPNITDTELVLLKHLVTFSCGFD